MTRAVRFDHYGDRDVLQVVDVDVPRPEAGEVAVRVRAAGTNPGEAAIRSGAMDAMFPATFPSGQGSDLAGVVEQVGEGVEDLVVGSEVLGWSERRSSQAEVVVVPETQLVPKPPALSWEVAGSLHVVGCTAYAAVRAVAAGPGDRVGVSAAAGGVGGVVVQLLRLRGAEVVALASEPNHDWLRSVGARPVAYGEGVADRVRAEVPEGLTAFVDCFGPEYVDLALELGVEADRIDTIIAFQRAGEVGARAEGSAQATSREVLAEMAAHVAAGEIEVPVAATYPLEQVREAYAELELRHTRGKIVLLP